MATRRATGIRFSRRRTWTGCTTRAGGSWISTSARLARRRALSEKQKGDLFQGLVKAFLELEPQYASKLKHVWLLREVPPAIARRLRLPAADKGIDLVAESRDGEFWAIQRKYRQDTDYSLSWRDISTFTGLGFGVCDGVSFGLGCSTTERITHVLKQQERIGFCALDVRQGLDTEFFRRLRAHLTRKREVLKPLRPRPHQRNAIKDGHRHYVEKRARRGKLIMPCGSGKSLTAYWIACDVKVRRVVVAVPSLALIRQTLEVWLRETLANARAVEWICVCSDETAGRIERDDLAVLRQDLGVPCLTEPREIASWLGLHAAHRIVAPIDFGFRVHSLGHRWIAWGAQRAQPANLRQNKPMSQYAENYPSIPVAELGVEQRSTFILRTYAHLVGAIALFTGIEIFIFRSGYDLPIAKALTSVSWLVVLGGFMVASWLATRVAARARSKAAQYAGLVGCVLVQAIIFVPLLYVAERVAKGGVIASAAGVTLAGFGLLTGIVFVTRKDFSFLRIFLVWTAILALLTIVVATIFGLTLGFWFSLGMVVFAGAAILHDTSNVLRYYPEDRYISAALQLFASVALMFWYVLQLFMSRR